LTESWLLNTPTLKNFQERRHLIISSKALEKVIKLYLDLSLEAK